jgi:fibronectin type 3 domain-containing protein
VVCGLWPKNFLHAPYSDDTIAPTWKSAEPLKVLARTNQIRLNWEAAEDNEPVAGYDIWRSENGGTSFDHLYSVTVSMYTDNLAQSGRAYQYYIRAYDLAGNKSNPSNTVSVEVPMKIALFDSPSVPV